MDKKSTQELLNVGPYGSNTTTPWIFLACYLAFFLVLSVGLRSDVLSSTPSLARAIAFLNDWIPSIKYYSSLTDFPEVAAVMWSLVWLSAPIVTLVSHVRRSKETLAAIRTTKHYRRTAFFMAFMAIAVLVFMSQLDESMGASIDGPGWFIELSSSSRIALGIACAIAGVAVGLGVHLALLSLGLLFSRRVTIEEVP